MPTPLTLASARQALWKYASNVPYSTATSLQLLDVTDTINQCCERLITLGKWRGLTPRLNIAVYDNSITLPRWLDTVLGCTPVPPNNEPGFAPLPLFGQWYEFCSGGPGRIGTAVINGLMDWTSRTGGGWATFRDPADTFYIKATPRRSETQAIYFILRGLDENDEPIYSGVNSEGVMLGVSIPESSAIFVNDVPEAGSIITFQTASGPQVLRFVVDADNGGNTTGTAVEVQSTETNEEIAAEIVSVINADVALLGLKYAASFCNTVLLIDASAANRTDITTDSANLTVSVVLDGTATGTSTTQKFNRLDSWIKTTPSNGIIDLVAVDVSTAEETTIAIVEPGELVSAYRRYRMPAASANNVTEVEVVAKRAYVPMRSDYDIVFPSHLGAIKLMMMALRYEDTNDLERAAVFEQKALSLLDNDKQEYDGDATIQPLQFMGEYGVGDVVNTH